VYYKDSKDSINDMIDLPKSRKLKDTCSLIRKSIYADANASKVFQHMPSIYSIYRMNKNDAGVFTIYINVRTQRALFRPLQDPTYDHSHLANVIDLHTKNQYDGLNSNASRG
jgi:hypothetical protein